MARTNHKQLYQQFKLIQRQLHDVQLEQGQRESRLTQRAAAVEMKEKRADAALREAKEMWKKTHGVPG